MAEPGTVSVARSDAVLRIALDRPEVRNAMNPEMIAELRAAFDAAAADGAVRIVVVEGNGPAFCAGGDLNWMSDVFGKSEEEVTAESRELMEMYRAIDTCPKLVVARVHGAVFAGAMGIIAASDVVIAERETRFCVSEVRIGLAPGLIAALLLPRIGPHWLRYLAKSAIVFDADTALRANLVHEIASGVEELDARVAAHVELGLQASPDAIAATGRLIAALGGAADEDAFARGLEVNVEARFSGAAQEGISAFLEKRRPAWWASGDG